MRVRLRVRLGVRVRARLRLRVGRRMLALLCPLRVVATPPSLSHRGLKPIDGGDDEVAGAIVGGVEEDVARTRPLALVPSKHVREQDLRAAVRARHVAPVLCDVVHGAVHDVSRHAAAAAAEVHAERR